MRVRTLLAAAIFPLLVSVAAAQDGGPLKIHIISGSKEYKSEPSLKAFKPYLEKTYKISCTASWGRDGVKELEGLDAVREADLLIVFARRMKLGEDQMKLIRAHWDAGKPVIGLRTSSHAFQKEDNELFDRKIMGGNYSGHFGNEPVKVTNESAQADHPILEGVGPFTSRKLYKMGPTGEGAIVLQKGDIGKASHVVTIVNEYKGGRMFYSSLGVPGDFEDENFRRLLVNAIFWTTKRDPSKMSR